MIFSRVSKFKIYFRLIQHLWAIIFPLAELFTAIIASHFYIFPFQWAFQMCDASEKLLIIWDVSLFFLHIVISHMYEVPSICINPMLASKHKFATLLFTTAWRNRQKSVCVEINFPLVHFRRLFSRCNECLSHKCTRGC